MTVISYRRREDDASLSHLRSENASLSSVLEQRDDEYAKLKAELDALKDEEAQLGGDVDDLVGQVKTLSDENLALRREIQDGEKQLDNDTRFGRKVRIDLRESTVNKTSREGQLANIQSHIKGLESELDRERKVLICLLNVFT